MSRHTTGSESIWADFATAFLNAETKVGAYTEARRAYDAKFSAEVKEAIRDRVGDGFRMVWFNERASDRRVTASKFATPTCNAGNFRSTCELAYSGRFEKDPGNRWENHRPTPHPEDLGQGLSWRIAVGGGDGRDYLWGGEQPTDLEKIASSLDDLLVSLRDDAKLKGLYLAAEGAEASAKDSLEELPVLADHAIGILRHGQDIPGACPYCASWSPRL